jgi:hypothetical protein
LARCADIMGSFFTRHRRSNARCLLEQSIEGRIVPDKVLSCQTTGHFMPMTASPTILLGCVSVRVAAIAMAGLEADTALPVNPARSRLGRSGSRRRGRRA